MTYKQHGKHLIIQASWLNSSEFQQAVVSKVCKWLLWWEWGWCWPYRKWIQVWQWWNKPHPLYIHTIYLKARLCQEMGVMLAKGPNIGAVIDYMHWLFLMRTLSAWWHPVMVGVCSGWSVNATSKFLQKPNIVPLPITLPQVKGHTKGTGNSFILCWRGQQSTVSTFQDQESESKQLDRVRFWRLVLKYVQLQVMCLTCDASANCVLNK